MRRLHRMICGHAAHARRAMAMKVQYSVKPPASVKESRRFGVRRGYDWLEPRTDMEHVFQVHHSNFEWCIMLYSIYAILSTPARHAV
jgi:hypothetical protein